MPRLILLADTVLTGLDDGTVVERGAVEIVDGRIESVTALSGSAPRGAEVVDLGDQVLMPGLVNAHAHLPMTLFRGVAEGASLLTLRGWWDVIRVLEEHLEPHMFAAPAEVSLAEMIDTGTTYVADQYFGLENYDHVVRRSGIRAELAYGIVELGDDEARTAQLAAAEAYLERLDTDPLVRGWIGPHAFFVDNQLDAIQAETALASASGRGLHTHFATAGDEDSMCGARFGMTALRMLDRLGVLDHRLLLAHACELVVADLPVLADRPTSVVAAPSVAAISGAPTAPVREALDAGVNVAIGTDNACHGNSFDLFEELRTLARAVSLETRTPWALSPRELLGIGTWRGHRALSGGDAVGDGRLAPGGVADLIALPRTTLHRGPRRAQSLEAAVIFGARGSDTTSVLVAGRFLKRDGSLTTLDPRGAYLRCDEDFGRIADRADIAALTV